MDERIRIEAPDASRAAFLMGGLVGRFQARLIESGVGWEIVVDSEPEPFRVLNDVIEAVQRWVEAGDGDYATITFRDRVYTIGNRARALAPRELAPVG